MKKKAVEIIAEKRQRRIEALETLCGKRREELKNLQNENQGLRQTADILSAIILEAIETRGCVEISKEAVAKGIKLRYTLENKEDRYVLRRE